MPRINMSTLTVSQLNDAAAALNTRADDIDATADQLRSFADQVTDEKLQDSLSLWQHR